MSASARPEKILIFSLTYDPFIGGAEVAIKEITDRISREDIEFHMVTARFDRTLLRAEQIGNVTVHRIGLTRPHATIADFRKFPLHLNKLLFQFWAFFTAWQLHRRHHFDAIWAMMAHSCGVPAGLFKTFFPRVGYVLTLQEGDPPEYIERKMRIFGPLFRRAFVLADTVQAISAFLGNWARRMGFQGPLEVIPNAVNVLHFSREPSAGEIDAVRSSMGLAKGDVALITTSRLVHKNAIDDVIAALPMLPSQVSFVICGIGPEEEKLQQLAQDLGVSGRVRFIGQVDHAVLPVYLKACDIFIRPSRSEGMGNSFIEAMAAGLPVIATQEGGIADFLFDATRNPDVPATGWAVDKDSPKEIAEAVRDMLAHPERVREVAAYAQQMVREKYDWDLIAREMQERVFGRVCNMR